MMHETESDDLPEREGLVREEYWAAVLVQGELAPSVDVASFQWPDPVEKRHPRARPAVAPEAPYGDEFWEQLRSWQAEGATIEAPVIGCNKGGLLVRIREGIGFVPASQLAKPPEGLGTSALRDELQRLIGRTIPVRLLEVDPARARVICSERAVSWRDDDVAARLANLANRVGEAESGVVRSLCEFGAFVDLHGVDGLVHISELSWERIGHPSEVLAVDDPVEVVVISVDRAARRVALSLKRLQPDPWELVAGRYRVGDIVEARISNIVDFGAFARLPEGVDGLIHVSELADGHIEQPRSVVSEGESVRAKILHIDRGGRRLGLSLRQARTGIG